MRLLFLFLLHLPLLHAHRPTPTYLFHLPQFCKSTICIQKSLTLLKSTCTNIQHHEHQHLIRATCNLQDTLLKSRRFSTIQSTHLSLFHKTFQNISTLSFHPSKAVTPAGHEISIATQKRLRCSITQGAGVTVYIIDTGCRTTHDQLRGRVVAYPAPGSRFRSGEDDHGHGTHVAATIAGSQFGLAPRVKVVCIKALSEGNEGSGKDVMSAIEHVLKVHPYGKPGIISISLGVRAERRYSALDRAIGRAAAKGIVPVVAAGNSGRDACTFTPARADRAVTVAAVASNGSLAEFSNWGKCVVVGAPGVGVWSAVAEGDSLYGVTSGTSMAAPFVSALVALRLSHGGGTVEEIRQWLWEISRESRGLKVVSVGKLCRWMKRHRYR